MLILSHEAPTGMTRTLPNVMFVTSRLKALKALNRPTTCAVITSSPQTFGGHNDQRWITDDSR